MGKHSKIKILISLLCIIMLCGCKVKEGKNSDDGIEAKPTIEQPTETVMKVSEKPNTESEKQNMELHNQTQEDIKSIYLEMKERGITKIMRDDSSTSHLFISMWKILINHYWYGENYINRFHNRDSFCSYYEELMISFIDNVYWLGERDIVGGEGFYAIGFEINNTEDSVDIIGNNGFFPDSTRVIGQLEFGNPDEAKIVLFDNTYIPMYTDMRKCINNELFLGNWYDDKGTCYSFGSDYKITHDGLVEIYEPFCFALNRDYNFIEILDTDGETINKVYGYTITDDTLSFYETMEVDLDSVLCPKPFLVLTRKSK